MNLTILRAGLVAALLFGAGELMAGQLHVEEYGLEEVARTDAMVLVGEVQSVSRAARGGSVRLKVEKVLSRSGERMRLVRGAAGKADRFESVAPPKAGDVLDLEVYGGVVWDDPHKSPIDERLRGRLSLDAVKKGMRVVSVDGREGSAELLDASAANLRSLDVFFTPGALEKYGAQPVETLETDLANEQLAELAFTTLQKRGELRTPALLTVERRLLWRFFKEGTVEQKRRFIEEALPTLQKDEKRRVLVTDLALEQLDASLLPSLPALLRLYDPKTGEGRDHHYELATKARYLVEEAAEKKQKVDLSPVADALFEALLYRPDYADAAKMTALFDHTDRTTRVRVAARALSLLQRSPGARNHFDWALFSLATKLGSDAPAHELLAPLALLDPERVEILSTKETLASGMLDLGAAIAKAAPSETGAVQAALDVLLLRNLPVTEESKARYLKTVGTGPRGHASKETLTLSPGQPHLLGDGTQLLLTARDDGRPMLLIRDAMSRSELAVDPADPLRESWTEPLLIVIERVEKDGRVVIHVAPGDKEPPTLPLAEATAKAETAAKGLGCSGASFTELDPFTGRYVFEAEGKGGKCRVVVGRYTGRTAADRR